MCIEDIRMGRQSHTAERTIATTAASRQAIGPSPLRTQLTFGPPSTDSVWLSITDPAVVGNGLLLRATDRPLSMSVQEFGDMVTQAWFVIPTAGTPNITIYESVLARE